MMKIKSFLGFIYFLLFVRPPESPDQPFPGNLNPEHAKSLLQNVHLLAVLSGQVSGNCTKTAGISIRGHQPYLPFLFFNQ
jgi:hypothetical protein